MSGDRWSRIEQIFQAVLDLPPAERAGYVERACAGDAELLKEVESLLLYHEHPGQALESPIAGRLTSARFPAGFRAGPYVVVRRLGAGGMGEVYLAQDTRLERKVALKFVSGQMVDARNAAARFGMEARAISALNHPNIVTIYEAGEVEGAAYIATEYVEGETVADRLRRGPMQREEILRVGMQTAAALEAAHAAGIMHRDIKPANIMIRGDGLVKVLDFGLAKMPRSGSTERPDVFRTQSGMIVGTAAYMSPEQASGKPVDNRTDIWSLGTVLYEMAAGHPPFEQESMPRTMAAILTEEPAPLQSAGWLEPAVRRALAKRPEERYRTAAELLADLRGLERGKPVRRRKRLSVGMTLAAGGLAALAAAGATYWKWGRNPIEEYPRQPVVRLTVRGKPLKVAASRDGRYLAYVSRDGDQQGLWVRQVGPESDLRLSPPRQARYTGIAFSPDGSYVYFVAYEGSSPKGAAFRIPTLGGEPRKIVDDVDSPISFSPDGSRFTFLRGDPKEKRMLLMSCAQDGSGERVIAFRPAPLYFDNKGPSWSPDGKRIALAAYTRTPQGIRSNVVVVEVATGAERALGSQSWNLAAKTVWTRGQRGVLQQVGETGSSTFRLVHISYPDGKTSEVSNELSSYYDFDLSAAEPLMAAVRMDDLSGIWMIPPGETFRPKLLTSDTGRYYGLAWLGNTLVTASDLAGQPDLYTIPVDGGNPGRLTEDGSVEADPSPCGEGVVFSTNRGGPRNIWRAPRDGGQATQLTAGHGPDEKPQCSPDGRWFYYTSWGSGKAAILRASTGGGPAAVVKERARGGVLSPDGKAIVCQLFDEDAESLGHVAILDAQTGAVVRRFRELPREGRLGWHPDGRAVVFVKRENGVGNLWKQPLDGGSATQLTRFSTEQVSAFAWSRDGKTLACVRGLLQSELVRIGGRQSRGR